MRELNDTTPPAAEIRGALRIARRVCIGETLATLASALAWIGVLLLVNRLAFGTWVPVWWLAALAGVVLPELGGAGLDLAAITTGRMTYTVDLPDGTTVHTKEVR